MPPQYNRRSTGPRANLQGPVQRSFQQQSLQSRPAATEGPDMSKAEAFGALSNALNVGLNAVGQYRASVRAEEDQAFQTKLEETKLAFGRGEATMGDYDALMTQYGSDDRRREQILQGMGQAEYFSRMGVAGNYVGSRLFQFDNAEDRAAILQNLPGEAPMEEELADYMENFARQTVPTFDGLADNDRAQMLRFGLRQFSDEIKAGRKELAADAAAAELRSNAQAQSAIITGMTLEGVDQDAARTELYDLALTRNGGDPRRTVSALSRELATTDLETLDAVFSGLSPEDTGATQGELTTAYQSARNTLLASQVQNHVLELTDTYTGPDGVGYAYLSAAESGLESRLPSDQVGDALVNTYMQENNLGPADRPVVEQQLKPVIDQAVRRRKADEKLAANLGEVQRGTASQDQIDDTYTALALGLRDTMSDLRNDSLSVDDVHSMFGAIGQEAGGWFDISNDGAYTQLPKELVADLRSMSNGSDAQRLAAVAVFQGMGGVKNPQLMSALPPKERAMLATVGYMAGRFGVASEGGIAMSAGMTDADRQSLSAMLHLGEGMQEMPMSDLRTSEILSQLEAVGVEQYGEGWATGGPAGASLIGGINGDVMQQVLFLANGVPDTKVAGAYMLGLIESMSFKPVQLQSGESDAPVMVHDPANRMWSVKQGTVAEWTDSVIDKLGIERFESQLGDVPGLKKFLASGKGSLSFDASSLSPSSQMAIWTFLDTESNGVSQVMIPWDEVGLTAPKKEISITGELLETINNPGERRLTDTNVYSPFGPSR